MKGLSSELMGKKYITNNFTSSIEVRSPSMVSKLRVITGIVNNMFVIMINMIFIASVMFLCPLSSPFPNDMIIFVDFQV